MSMHIRNSGFTLIELAMVLFILGLLLSSFLAPLTARVEQRERNDTQIQLDEIKEVLLGYAIRNGRFPCPDCRLASEGTCAAINIDDGAEDRVTGVGGCKSEIGYLPWNDLGVDENDAWGQHFTYRVSEDFADDTDGAAGATGCSSTTTSGISFSLCSDGDIKIYSSDTATSGSAGDVADDVPAIVISHGKNWPDNAPSDDEAENYDNGGTGDVDNKFVDKDYSQGSGSEFDDMLIWISPHILRTMSVKAGILP